MFSTIHKGNYHQVRSIYDEGIRTGLATFEATSPSWEDWDNTHLDYGRIALLEGNTVMGWAALSAVSNRCVYQGVAEVSVYVAETARGMGAGKKLLNELIRISELNGIWTLQSGIMTENIASIKLHEKCGFRKIGVRERVAKLQGEWMDNLLMERRSKKVGL